MFFTAKENFIALFIRGTFWGLEPHELRQRLEDDGIEAHRLPEIENLELSALDILTIDNYGEQTTITKGQLIKFKKYLESHGREYFRFVLSFFVNQPHGAVPLKDLTWVELLGTGKRCRYYRTGGFLFCRDASVIMDHLNMCVCVCVYMGVAVWWGCLTSGGFGSVHRVRNRLNGDEFAIKLIYFEVGLAALVEDVEFEDEQMNILESKLLLDRHFLREVESQQRVHNPYVCSIQAGHWGMTGNRRLCVSAAF